MEELIINEKSWHYRLASFYSLADYRDLHGKFVKLNLCSYSKYVLKGVIIILICLTVFSFIVLYPLGLFLAWVLAVLFSLSLPEMDVTAAIVPGATALLAGSYILSKVLEKFAVWYSKFHHRRQLARFKKRTNKQDGFIVAAFKAWNEKYCMPIRFKNE